MLKVVFNPSILRRFKLSLAKDAFPVLERDKNGFYIAPNRRRLVKAFLFDNRFCPLGSAHPPLPIQGVNSRLDLLWCVIVTDHLALLAMRFAGFRRVDFPAEPFRRAGENPASPKETGR